MNNGDYKVKSMEKNIYICTDYTVAYRPMHIYAYLRGGGLNLN